MYRFIFRVSRVVLGFTLVAALAACTDEQILTEPHDALAPQFGVGDVITVTNTSGGTALGSLRWAVSQVTGGEVIRFAPSLAGQTIVLDTTIVSFKPYTIEGPADRGITISGGGKVRVLQYNGSTGDTSVLRNVTITGGVAPSSGSGINAAHVLFVENTTLTGNTGPTAALVGRNVVLTNSTVSGNTITSHFDDEAIHGTNSLRLVNSTIAHNAGGGAKGPMISMRNSMISDNTSGNCTLLTTILREGTNITDDDTCGAPFEIIIADPMLAPLADNGGPSRTHALMPGSPAINTGTNCSVSVDQRFAPRDAQCDVGAFEFVDFTTADITISANATIDKVNGWAVLTGTVRCSRNEIFDLRVRLHQSQKAGQSTVDVDATSTVAVSCSTTARPWSVALVSTTGSFQIGTGTAAVSMLNAKPWITPTSVSQAVKLINARK